MSYIQKRGGREIPGLRGSKWKYPARRTEEDPAIAPLGVFIREVWNREISMLWDPDAILALSLRLRSRIFVWKATAPFDLAFPKWNDDMERQGQRRPSESPWFVSSPDERGLVAERFSREPSRRFAASDAAVSLSCFSKSAKKSQPRAHLWNVRPPTGLALSDPATFINEAFHALRAVHLRGSIALLVGVGKYWWRSRAALLKEHRQSGKFVETDTVEGKDSGALQS